MMLSKHFLLIRSKQSNSNMLKAELHSDPSNIAQVEKLVEDISSKYHLDQETRANLLISLTEAVNNAIIHGNNSEPSKKVSIQLLRNGNKLAVKVQDQGQGFDFKQLPDPTAPENICNCGGRGVFLMNQLCDEMSYSNGGSTVEMRFRLQNS
ncbi:MAG: ATP-binding protein [Bacteroidota bacterium]